MSESVVEVERKKIEEKTLYEPNPTPPQRYRRRTHVY